MQSHSNTRYAQNDPNGETVAALCPDARRDKRDRGQQTEPDGYADEASERCVPP